VFADPAGEEPIELREQLERVIDSHQSLNVAVLFDLGEGRGEEIFASFFLVGRNPIFDVRGLFSELGVVVVL